MRVRDQKLIYWSGKHTKKKRSFLKAFSKGPASNQEFLICATSNQELPKCASLKSGIPEMCYHRLRIPEIWQLKWRIPEMFYLIWAGTFREFSIHGSTFQEFLNWAGLFRGFLICGGTSQEFLIWGRVAELGSLSSRAKMAMKIFDKRAFTNSATNASFMCVIPNLQFQLSEICNIYHVIVHFFPKKHCFWPKKALFFPKISKRWVNRDKS